MRRRKTPKTDSLGFLVCRNCHNSTRNTTDGLCVTCHNYLSEYGRHRPAYKQQQFKDAREYLVAINVELIKMAKEFKNDKDLVAFLDNSIKSNGIAVGAMNRRIWEQQK